LRASARKGGGQRGEERGGREWDERKWCPEPDAALLIRDALILTLTDLRAWKVSDGVMVVVGEQPEANFGAELEAKSETPGRVRPLPPPLHSLAAFTKAQTSLKAATRYLDPL